MNPLRRGQNRCKAPYHFFVGTKAQFIKMAPVMLEFERRGLRYRYVDSGQHADFTASPRKVFEIREPDLVLHDQGDIRTISNAAAWYTRLSTRGLFNRNWLREEVFPGGGTCLIHGDTMSTLLGLRLAKRAGLAVAHIEAGLRSYNLLDPFPEELVRILCMRRSDLLFTPSAEATRNLQTMKVRGTVVELPGNTVVDSIRLALERAPENLEVPARPFALATCHRLETIRIKRRLHQVVQLFNRVSEQLPVLFVRHKPTRIQLERFGLLDELSPRVIQSDIQDYVSFANLLSAAEVVLTDGGSIQEECAALVKPCLILRDRSERTDGLGTTATLWRFRREAEQSFLESIQLHRGFETRYDLSPSEVLVDRLEAVQKVGFDTKYKAD